MPDLPARPDLDHLRHQARDLLRAAKAGDAAAVGRMAAVSDRRTLSAAQLAVAREYGFASWARLKAEVEARTLDQASKAQAFLEASVRNGRGRAARLLAATPEIADYSFGTAVVLGDAERVRRDIERDPGLATRGDERWGWTPLHAVCGSRWHVLDPARAEGMAEVARLLLDAGASLEARIRGQGGARTPLQCATATASTSAGNEGVIRLLLERGSVPSDDDLYLVGFAPNAHQCLRLLLDHTPDVAGTVESALGASISKRDTEACRLLLEAGADPRRFVDDYDPPAPVVYAAVRRGCPTEFVALLLTHGADPDAPGPDGLSPHRLAVRKGRSDLAALLHEGGARDEANDGDLLLSACRLADRAGAQRMLDADPGLLGRLTDVEKGGAVVQAAEEGRTAAVELMLDLGFPMDLQGGDWEGTPLHAAGYAGSPETVRLLLARGAAIEARDGSWQSTALVWAAIGSGERPERGFRPDWVATVRTLLDAGASLDELSLDPDDTKPPSPEVAQLLRERGVSS